MFTFASSLEYWTGAVSEVCLVGGEWGGDGERLGGLVVSIPSLCTLAEAVISNNTTLLPNSCHSHLNYVTTGLFMYYNKSPFHYQVNLH